VPILDDAAANASLAGDFGAARGPNAADSHSLELWDGDPTLEGSAELSGNGYAAATILPADWSTPAGRTVTASVVFAAPTAAWATATHCVLRDPVSRLAWDYGQLAEPAEVTEAASAGPTVTVAVFYDNPED
jgi:hypothetical protein